jgi:hypothetical protein
MMATCQRWYLASCSLKLLPERLLRLHPPIVIALVSEALPETSRQSLPTISSRKAMTSWNNELRTIIHSRGIRVAVLVESVCP